ncbi:MAG: hypothetical protein AB7J35_09740 [Dehalococcoidia bacterium]
MMRRGFVSVLVAMALAGSALGLLAPTPGKAVTSYEIRVNPGGATNALTCGWHVTCKPPITWGNALDWGNSANAHVHWRSWGYRGSGSGNVGTAYVYTANTATCYRIAADIYSTMGTFLGDAAYQHTRILVSEGTNWSIAGSTGWSYTSRGDIGYTVGTELAPTCPWTDPHLHQYSTSGSGWYANTDVYPDGPDEGTGYDLTSWSNWQNRRTWSE